MSLPIELRRRIDEMAESHLLFMKHPHAYFERNLFIAGAEAMYELMVTPSTHISTAKAEKSTHMVTNETKKSTHMVTSHMGYFSDEGIVK